MKHKSQTTVSLILLLSAAVVWGFAFSAQKAAVIVPPLTLGMFRSFLAGFFLIIIIVIFDKVFHTGRTLFSRKKIVDVNKSELIGGVICGAVLALASFLQQLGINSGTEPGKASFITALYVVIVPIYALVQKKKSPLNVWLGVLISVLGFYFLCVDGKLGIKPNDLLVLGCAFVFPVHILTIDTFSPKCDGIRMSCVQFFSAGIFNLIFALIFESPLKMHTFTACLWPILFLGIGSSGIAYTLQILGQRGINPAVASILLSLESVFGAIGSAIFMGDIMTSREYIGCAIVFVAVIVSQIDPGWFKKKTTDKKAEK